METCGVTVWMWSFPCSVELPNSLLTTGRFSRQKDNTRVLAACSASPLWIQQYSKLFSLHLLGTQVTEPEVRHITTTACQRTSEGSEPSTGTQRSWHVSLHSSRKALWLVIVLMRLRSAKRDFSSRRSTSVAHAFQLSDHYHCSIEAASLPGRPPVLSCWSSKYVSHSFLHLQDVDGILLRLPLHMQQQGACTSLYLCQPASHVNVVILTVSWN